MRRGIARSARGGWSLVELLMVLTLLGILAAVVMYRYSHSDRQAVPRAACAMRRAEIDAQVGLWRRAKGTWPNQDLSDIGASSQYFPLGLPVCPCDGSAYQLDPATRCVVPHQH